MSTNQSEVFSRPNSDAKIHDLEQYTLYTDTPGRKNYRARLVIGERNGAPRITVWTNLEEGPSIIAMGLHPAVFEEFLNQFKEIALKDGVCSRKIENLIPDPTVKLEKGESRENVQKVVKNSLWFGKDDNGVCWIGVEQKDVPKLAFRILPSAWHNFYHSDGRQVTATEMSSRYTLSLIESVRRAMDRWTARLRPAWEPDPSKSKKKATEAMNSAVSTNLDDDFKF